MNIVYNGSQFTVEKNNITEISGVGPNYVEVKANSKSMIVFNNFITPQIQINTDTAFDNYKIYKSIQQITTNDIKQDNKTVLADILYNYSTGQDYFTGTQSPCLITCKSFSLIIVNQSANVLKVLIGQ